MHRYDTVTVQGTKSFLPQQHAVEEACFFPPEFRRKCIRHRIVNVQNNFCAEQPRDNGRKDQEIRHVVDMDDCIATLYKECCRFDQTPKKKYSVLDHILEMASPPISGLVQSNKSNASKHFLRCCPEPSQRDKINVKSSLNSCFGFSSILFLPWRRIRLISSPRRESTYESLPQAWHQRARFQDEPVRLCHAAVLARAATLS